MKFLKFKITIVSVLFVHSLILAKAYDESNIHELIKLFLPDDSIIIEAGAHHGSDTVIMSKLFPNGMIHAFEPFPPSYQTLKQNVNGLNNVTCYPYALGNKTGKSPLYLRPDNAGCNCLLPPAIEAPCFDKNTIEIDCITLDDWAKQHGIRNVSGMWLDMEGFELLALKAATEVLKSVKVIYTEINFQEFRQNNPLYYELRAWLEMQGFTEIWKSVSVIHPPRYARLDKAIVVWQGNALFIRV